jgi:hypothetical protein
MQIVVILCHLGNNNKKKSGMCLVRMPWGGRGVYFIFYIIVPVDMKINCTDVVDNSRQTQIHHSSWED